MTLVMVYSMLSVISSDTAVLKQCRDVKGMYTSNECCEQDETSQLQTIYQPVSKVTFHGVASGDPARDGFVLWTRAVPDANEESVKVKWSVSDENSQLERSGIALAKKEFDYTTQVIVSGLPIGTYSYTFSHGDTTSVVGRAKTLHDNAPRLASASCAGYASGYYTLYKDMATQDLDAVLFLGDFIYEDGPSTDGIFAAPAIQQYARNGDLSSLSNYDPPHRCVTLDDYRKRYKQYLSDANLQAARAKHTWIQIWDDHELANNRWAEDGDGLSHTAEDGPYSDRKLAARKAWCENVPSRACTNYANTNFPLDNNVEFVGQREYTWGTKVSVLTLNTRNGTEEFPLIDLMVDHDSRAFLNDTTGEFVDPFNTMNSHPVYFARFVAARENMLARMQAETNVYQLGPAQMEWLMNKLANPTADVTYVMSGTQFVDLGDAYAMTISAALAPVTYREQKAMMIKTGAQIRADYLATDSTGVQSEQLVRFGYIYNIPSRDSWAGRKSQRQQIYDACTAMTEKECVLLSGDIHNSMVKQGDGVVEITSSGISSWPYAFVGPYLLEMPRNPVTDVVAMLLWDMKVLSSSLSTIEGVKASLQLRGPALGAFSALSTGDMATYSTMMERYTQTRNAITEDSPISYFPWDSNSYAILEANSASLTITFRKVAFGGLSDPTCPVSLVTSDTILSVF